jgi:adenine/guanine phosphoribosyltransferase-like PRPP-binding protein
MQKLFITYSDIHKLVAKASADIEASGWEPDIIVAIASGGFIPAGSSRPISRRTSTSSACGATSTIRPPSPCR